MSNVLTDICHWARQQPPWEQEALRRILACEVFDEAVYTLLAEMLIEGKSGKPADFRPFEEVAVATRGPRPLVVGLSNITNVNALSGGQTLEFGPALTAIFGCNGAGKSGYARIFGSACFSRGDRDVLPNIFWPGADTRKQTAAIVVQQDGKTQTLAHAFGQPMPELSGFYVFDSTCVATHLSKANALSFSPAGLSTLEELVRHTDKVREIVTARVDDAERRHTFGAVFDGATVVAEKIASLDAKTNLVALKQLSTLTQKETARVEEVEREIASLKLLDVRKAARAARSEIRLLQWLLAALPEIEASLIDDRLAELREWIRERARRKEHADNAGAEQFAVEGLHSVGSGAWGEFIHAARHLAEIEAPPDAPYPKRHDRCLLCQQELSDNAVSLLHRLWDFLKGEARRLLAESEQRLGQRKSVLEALNCSLSAPTTAVHTLLSEKAPELLRELTTFLTTAESRRRSALAALADFSALSADLPVLPDTLSPKLEALAQRWIEGVEELEKTDPAQKITVLQRELAELYHRRLLGKHFAAVGAYVTQLTWADTTRKKIKNSRHITFKYNELFEERVTGRYRELFEHFVGRLGRPLRAQIGTRAQKGAAIKTLELSLPEGVNHPKASPQYVFSEGEKRAVVLADFLAEVTIDPHSAGIILDDPVTSLDAEWKETIARVLVEEASQRQVIVFTHDLHFLYLLRNAGDACGIELRAHWIRRADDGTPGYVSLDNSPASEKDFKSPQRATEYCNRAAKTSSAEEQESLLKSGFGALRTTYEVFVISDLFNDVIKRFDERISIDRLREAPLDCEIAKTVADKIAYLSRFIEGHSHSDTFAATAPPTVETLRAEVGAFDALKARLKELKKQRAAAGKS